MSECRALGLAYLEAVRPLLVQTYRIEIVIGLS